MTGIWNAVLAKMYPAAQGYNIRLEHVAGQGFADLIAFHYINQGQTNEYGFLVVQAKKLEHESHDSTWRDAMDGLLRYLPGLKPKANPHRVYGIVAVGRWAQFVEYDRQTASLVALNGTGKLHVARQCRTIERLLRYIRNNH